MPGLKVWRSLRQRLAFDKQTSQESAVSPGDVILSWYYTNFREGAPAHMKLYTPFAHKHRPEWSTTALNIFHGNQSVLYVFEDFITSARDFIPWIILSDPRSLGDVCGLAVGEPNQLPGSPDVNFWRVIFMHKSINSPNNRRPQI